MDLDALMLSRIQFAFVISFHILFPAFTIGLASWLAVVEGLWLKTQRDVYRRLYQFWVKIFAVSFGMGVVSGIVMSFQFGTNWSRFTEATAPVLGPLFSYEVLTAFFLEATFLGVMLFGWNRVGRKMHFFATCMVAIGTLLSAFWILSANSWMHTPDGFELRDGIFYPVDWWAIVFNPSFPYRLVHMVFAAYLTTAFAILGVAGWYMRKGIADEAARVMLVMGVGFVSIVTPLQIFAGDLHGLNTLEYQPAKVAAMEAHWDTGTAPLVLFAWPDAADETNHFEVAIPHLGSFILTHEWDGVVPGLKSFPEDERPPVTPVFFTFRIMVGLGLLMLLAGVLGLWLSWRRRLFVSKGYHRFLVAMGPSGFIAVLAGWFTTEIGRQPYTVYGLLRTSESNSLTVSAPSVAATLTIFVVVYGIVFGSGMYFILRLIRKGPEARPEDDKQQPPYKTPARPLSYPDDPEGDA